MSTQSTINTMLTKQFLNTLKLLSVLSLCIISCFAFSNTTNSNNHSNHPSKSITIGIIIPLEHTALRDVVDGFKSVVSKQFPNAIFKVQNAQGDIKLQRNIIELFVGQKVDMVVPVGTTTTQMTLSLVKKQPIVSLAAEYSEANRQKLQTKNMTGVLDEIGAKKKFEMINTIIPNLKKITVIYHSGNEKNFDEIKQLESEAQKSGVIIQKLVIQTLPELQTVAKAVDEGSQAILILKDHLVVSGIRLLIPIAEERQIPLISGDEGSVREGATFALGVHERAIGEEGGKLAIQILQGTSIESLSMRDMQQLTIFYNKKAIEKQKVDIYKLKAFATKNHYGVLAVSPTK